MVVIRVVLQENGKEMVIVQAGEHEAVLHTDHLRNETLRIILNFLWSHNYAGLRVANATTDEFVLKEPDDEGQ